MNIYHGVVKGGNHIVHCDRLDEFFKEFIEYRKGKSKTKNFNKNIFPFQEGKKSDGNHPHNPEKDGYGAILYLNLDNDKTKKPVVYGEKPLGGETEFDYSTGGDLGINISKAFKIKKSDSSESSKGRQGNQQKEKIEKVLKDIGTTGEIGDTYGLDLGGPANQQSREDQEKSSNKENKTIWGAVGIGSFILLLLVLFLVYLFRRRKKIKK